MKKILVFAMILCVLALAMTGCSKKEEPAAEEPEEEPTRTFVPGQTRPAAPQPETPPASSVFEGFEGIKFSD